MYASMYIGKRNVDPNTFCGTFWDTVQVPFGAGDMQLIQIRD